MAAYSYIKFLVLKRVRKHNEGKLTRKQLTTLFYCTALAVTFLVSFLPISIAAIINGANAEKIPQTEAMLTLLSGIFNPLLLLFKARFDAKTNISRKQLVAKVGNERNITQD